MKIWLVAIILCLSLSGCSGNPFNRLSIDQTSEQCAGFGFQPGTRAYSNCLKSQPANRDGDAQQIANPPDENQATARPAY